MNRKDINSVITRENLLKHYQKYPLLQVEDMFKYIYQSSFGCEHLLSDENSVLNSIKKEFLNFAGSKEPCKDTLDGEYSRVSLSYMEVGLSAETLSRLFCLSAKQRNDGEALLHEKIAVLTDLVADGGIPFVKSTFDSELEKWRKNGFSAVHHSEAFRKAYCPSYRVIDNRYASFISLFCETDRLLDYDSVIIAVEGGSASGKSTLAEILQEVYDCNVFHMDDFFLRPEQRTKERLSEIGGNIDRERFLDEILSSVIKNQTVNYRPFDCQTMQLGELKSVEPKRLTVIEGVYSMHPSFSEYYDLSVFLRIGEEKQKRRIEKRNPPFLAKRFFEEWIPLENRYFVEEDIQKRCRIVIDADSL